VLHLAQLMPAALCDEHTYQHACALLHPHSGTQAMALTDPVTGRAALLLVQTDITSRAELEARMAALTEAQLTMLEQMFPRWVDGCMHV